MPAPAGGGRAEAASPCPRPGGRRLPDATEVPPKTIRSKGPGQRRRATPAAPARRPFPAGSGAMVIQGKSPGKPSYEPFSPQPIYEAGRFNVTVPVDGDYYIVVYGPTEGKYSLAPGFLEQFTAAEWLLIPFSVITIHLWEGQSLWFVFAPMILIVIGGLDDHLVRTDAVHLVEHAFAPAAVFIDLLDQRYLKHAPPYRPGSSVQVNLIGVNDMDQAAEGSVTWRILDSEGREAVPQGHADVRIPPYDKQTIPATVSLPITPGGYLLLAEFHPKDKPSAETIISRRYLRLGDQPTPYRFYDMKPPSW